MNSPDPAAIAALIAGLTTRGMDHGMSAGMAHHVLEVLEDADFAVVHRPEIAEQATTSFGVLHARFGPILAFVYPEPGSWVVHAVDDNGCWEECEDHAAIAAGILAGARWAQSESDKK
jgi:hypothetical protein